MPKLDLSLSPDEIENYLAGQRTVRVATAAADCTPHVVPLWFVWWEGAMFLNSSVENLTVENMLRSGRSTAVVDDGDAYGDLRGVALTCAAHPADDDPRLPEVEREWSRKYHGGAEPHFKRWRNRAWFRLEPERVASWDFRKIREARARSERERGRGG